MSFLENTRYMDIVSLPLRPVRRRSKSTVLNRAAIMVTRCTATSTARPIRKNIRKDFASPSTCFGNEVARVART